MPVSKKKLLRIAMKEKRALLSHQYPKASHHLATLFFEHFNLPLSTIVGVYLPIGSEFDTRPLLNMLLDRGYTCALPRITPEGLQFHLWTPMTPLVKGSFQTLEPPSTIERVIPHVLLVPLLAFDKRGHRLGYGQGHFDRYLHQHPSMTIGIGFKEQEVEEIPHQVHDFALNYILTEEGLLTFQGKEGGGD